jgi:hypothetical protein
MPSSCSFRAKRGKRRHCYRPPTTPASRVSRGALPRKRAVPILERVRERQAGCCQQWHGTARRSTHRHVPTLRGSREREGREEHGTPSDFDGRTNPLNSGSIASTVRRTSPPLFLLLERRASPIHPAQVLAAVLAASAPRRRLLSSAVWTRRPGWFTSSSPAKWWWFSRQCTVNTLDGVMMWDTFFLSEIPS